MKKALRFSRTLLLANLAAAFFMTGTALNCESQAAPSSRTQIVFLGTGTPKPDPDRSGPCTAIVVNGTAYLVDFGPGVVRRAAAAFQKGVTALDVVKLRVAFVTHLHSDHTVGYPDLIFTPWVMGRTQPLEVYGPKGIRAMTEHVLEAWKDDIQIRTQGLEHRDANGYRVNAHEIDPGIVYKDENVTVKAFLVPHGEWPQAFGYRFETPDRVIVISGDTSPSRSIVENCQKCDVLIHEAYSQDYIARMPNWLEYRPKYHTLTSQLAGIANEAKPGLLVIYHWGGVGGEEQLLKEIRSTYPGKTVVAHDLDIY